MSATTCVPASTLDGIKRKAKTIGREAQLSYLAALDVSARHSGFESFQHARKVIERGQRAHHQHSIFLSAYWRDTSVSPRAAGLETLEIKLSRSLFSFLSKHQCDYARNLEGFFVEYSDHLEMRGNADSQARAKELLIKAALTLRFVEATGLRPATTKVQRKTIEKAEELPSSDHISRWFCPDTGSWVMLDEPYGHVTESVSHERREAWIAAQGLKWAKPDWDGLYYPGHAVPFMISADEGLLNRAVTTVERLHEQSLNASQEWSFQSGGFYSQFASPGRQQSGKARKPRLGTTYGFSKNAVEYQRTEGYASVWRPLQQMSMDNHKEMGRTLKRLYVSNLPYEVHENLVQLQSELENWMFAEYRHEKRDDVDVDVYYGGLDIPRCSSAAEIIAAANHVRSIMVGTYLDSKPLRTYLKKLDYMCQHIQARNS
ncbi:DUF5623 domain-containing protein [Pseudomonas syringae]|uniref:DUF5623 domain-containing protein n=1 Tax=Pseudomonas syringae TaxID=317 RepID=UPI00076058DE|nr:DUF5623 domain-containing protein [Pseudomonas syringae]KWS27003.1 hypothetical protein AL061_14045 [Pseudomonas syringae pv. syringae]